MTTMIARDAFSSIHGIYRIHKAGAESFWLYLQNIGANGNISSTSRVVFFGTSQEQVESWISSRNEERSTVQAVNG